MKMIKKYLLSIARSRQAYFQSRISAFHSTSGCRNLSTEESFTYTDGKLSYSNTVNLGAHLRHETFGNLIEQKAKEKPSSLCYVFPHNRGLKLTYGDVEQRVNLMAQNLLSLGFKKGDRIAFILPNTHELVISLLASASIGLISILLNPGYQLVEIEYMLKKTNAKGVFLYDSFKTLNHYNVIKNLCPELDDSKPGELNANKLPHLKHVFILNSPLSDVQKDYPGTWSYRTIAEKVMDNKKHEKPIVDSDDPCLILFTSGTTGFPKGALMKHHGIINTVFFANSLPLKERTWGKICIPIPLFHVFGLGFGVLSPFYENGHETIFPFYLPDTNMALKSIDTFKCNSLMGAPTILIDLLNHPERSKHNLSSLKNILMGASTVPKDLILSLKSTLNPNNIIVGYGMTETSMGESFTRYSDSESYKHAYESIGRPLPFTENKIINPDNGQILPLGTDGELCIRGYNIISGYWDDEEKTRQSIDKNGWLKTGDVCSMDNDGYLYFKSRSKDIIIRGGVNIYPAEVESFLRTNPKVVDVAVVGVPDERFGEEVCAWVKLKQGETLTYEEMKSFCAGNIAVFKIPKYMKIVDNFPINPNGKVMKIKIAEMAKNEFTKKV